MSVTIGLVPLVIALASTLVAPTAAGAAIVSSSTASNLASDRIRKKMDEQNNFTQIPNMETVFNDTALLEKTLTEHGLTVNKVSENELVCPTNRGTLYYFRQSEQEPFTLRVEGVKNVQEVVGELEVLEKEYGKNVQAYSYDMLKSNLQKHNMSVGSEEILDDESIVLTLNIDE